MISHLQQIEHWMAAQHRLARWSPAYTIPSFERVDAMDHIVRATRTLGFAVKVELGTETLDSNEERNNINPVEVLAALTVLYVQVIAAAHTFGVASALHGGIYELTNKHIPVGAGPAPHDPNFGKLLDDLFPPPIPQKK